MVGPILEQMLSHLEFLGYQIERQEKSVVARCAGRMNLVMQELKGGILFSSIFGGSPNATSDRHGYVEALNALNQKAVCLRFYAGVNSSLYLEAWYPGMYDRANFGAFIEMFNEGAGLLADPSIGAAKYVN